MSAEASKPGVESDDWRDEFTPTTTLDLGGQSFEWLPEVSR